MPKHQQIFQRAEKRVNQRTFAKKMLKTPFNFQVQKFYKESQKEHTSRFFYEWVVANALDGWNTQVLAYSVDIATSAPKIGNVVRIKKFFGYFVDTDNLAIQLAQILECTKIGRLTSITVIINVKAILQLSQRQAWPPHRRQRPNCNSE